jgi:hypothetical protein
MCYHDISNPVFTTAAGRARRGGADVAQRSLRILLALTAVVALGAGCKDDPTGDPGGGTPTGQAPDFALADVNPTSATFAQSVSPRDYLQKVSAWYFGHAT